MIVRAAVLALLLAGEGAAAQASAIQLRDPGLGTGPTVLAEELARPHRVVPPSSDRYTLPRDSTIRQTVVVLGRDAYIEGKVQGDVVVVAGDLYMHPGAAIAGRAIAIGGGVYESTLASIGGGATAYRDFTYAIAPSATGFALDYRLARVPEPSPALTWPGVFGLRIPTYDRTNGVSIGGGPRLRVPNTGLAFEPALTYRTQLGRLDPSLAAVDSLARGTALRLVAERATLSNDAWIWSDLVNSASFLAAGEDARNYYRATRAELTLAHRVERANGELTPFLGGLVERARSVRPGLDARGGPWTFFGRHDPDDALRPNPPIYDGTTTSVIAGGDWRWEEHALIVRASGRAEAGRTSPECGTCSSIRPADFGQLTLDGAIEFPTFGTQTASVAGHGVASTTRDTPRQRYVYLGGGGTLPTLDMLSLGGDQLIFLDFRYNVPIQRIQLPLVGVPIVTLREALGGADVDRFPTIHQAAGVRLSLSVFYAEFLVDPVAHHGHAGVGMSLPR